MSAAELYAFWRIAERIGTDAFVVRRCLKRFERDELTIGAATDILWSYATLTSRTFGSLEEFARLIRGRAQNGVSERPSECDLDQRHDSDVVRTSATSSQSASEMDKSNPVPPAQRYIVTSTYRGPDRRRRRRIEPNSLLDTGRRAPESRSLWDLFRATRDSEIE